MKKEEFLKKIKNEKLDMGEYILVLDRITDEPLVIGCVLDQGKWKVFKTRERGGHFIIEEYDKENEAFDLLYDLLLSRHNRKSYKS
ncbi:hypothetical protein [Halalkalibacter sp. APA_J-10(15)]|uniref:hypothetical protein n=1 Tax=Halalkalibacter sp. APA_J-10(15) TaxID=2933805 RepID=UPI001FF123C9|nr:hypothetical protein [Halalkalibacter sp. APA_J-10(15)]MCK0473699.1 hypothetical protein [Halalkalibacter sp. APA_J-10(15)]